MDAGQQRRLEHVRDHHVFTYCLVLGLGLGVLSGINLMIASDRDLMAGVLGITIGLSVGAVGGILRTLYLRHKEPAEVSDSASPWPWATTALVVAPAVLGGLVRAAGGPAIVSLVLLACSAILFCFFIWTQNR